MRIGVLATRAGIRSSRIRFYEAQGVMPCPSRLTSGYRDYDDQALRSLRFIIRGQALGFSLQEIAAHIHSPMKGKARKARLFRKFEDKIADLDGLIEDLGKKRAALHSLLLEIRSDSQVDKPSTSA
jgi:MerR family copper efflux transcriptional regulator